MERNNGSNTDEQAAAAGTDASQAPAGESSEWHQIMQAPAYKELVKGKRKFVITVVAFSLVFFMIMTVLSTFTTVLNGQAVGSMTWGVVYGSAHFAVALILSCVYVYRANKWDRLAEEVRQETSEKRMGT